MNGRNFIDMGILGRVKIMYRILPPWFCSNMSGMTSGYFGITNRAQESLFTKNITGNSSHLTFQCVKESFCLGFISTFGDTGRFDLNSEVPKRVKTKEARDKDNRQVKT